MTRLILMIMLGFSLTTQLSAQDRRGGSDRLKSMKVAYITDQLNLTPEESQNFWPLYNELEDKLKENRKIHRSERIQENISEAEAKDLITRNFEAEQRELDLKIEYSNKFQTVISPVKLIRLQKAEKQFKRELLNRAKTRRGR